MGTTESSYEFSAYEDKFAIVDNHKNRVEIDAKNIESNSVRGIDGSYIINLPPSLQTWLVVTFHNNTVYVDKDNERKMSYPMPNFWKKYDGTIFTTQSSIIIEEPDGSQIIFNAFNIEQQSWRLIDGYRLKLPPSLKKRIATIDLKGIEKGIELIVTEVNGGIVKRTLSDFWYEKYKNHVIETYDSTGPTGPVGPSNLSKN